ncbi:MAG: hypothetical protein CMC82_03780 [Flavobacteriaceae bacterium]|nr:hypothetical protein [Flavobacteriaceae bacterium]|tara:strand:+ start:997 stop:2034 length:1038 start_codon:yes stop_codon:yes gene_type:complete
MAYNNMSGTVFLPAELRPRIDIAYANILSGNLSTSDAADVINVPRVSNATNNAILTNVNGDANNLVCESNLTFDGDTLAVVGEVSSSLNISASAFYGDGSNLINVRADNVVAEGPTNSLQFHDPSDGDLTGSINLTFSQDSLFLTGGLNITGGIELEGDFIPATANARDLGSPTKPWRALYISSSTIFFGSDSLSVEDGNMKFGSGSATKAFNVGHMHFRDRGIIMDQGRVFNLAAHQMRFHGGVAVKRNTISENHVMTNGEYLVAVQTDQLTGSNVTITLPPGNTVVDGQTFVIKDEGGLASSKPIRILTQADNLIDGQNSILLESPYAAITLYCDGSTKYFIC